MNFFVLELWFAQAGAGLEYRFTPQFGIFTDARYVFTEKTKDHGVARAGVRFAFLATLSPPARRRKHPAVFKNCTKNMILIIIKRITLLLAVTTVLVFTATGCQTAHGFGKDVEAAGDKIQEGTD